MLAIDREDVDGEVWTRNVDALRKLDGASLECGNGRYGRPLVKWQLPAYRGVGPFDDDGAHPQGEFGRIQPRGSEDRVGER